MPISTAQQAKLFDWLRAKGVRSDCPACGAEKWQAGDIVAPPTAPDGGGTLLGGPNFPLVQVVCQHCGHVMHFASTGIGLEAHAEQAQGH